MPDASSLSSPAVTLALAATIFAVMFALGLAIDVRDLRWAWSRPGLLVRGLVAVLVLVPAAGVAVAYLLDLPKTAQVGVALMAVSPGAPVALRRSLDAGGHHSFAAVLQVLVAMAAIVSMPASIWVLNQLYDTHGSLAPVTVARQVFFAQLLPVGLGLILRRMAPAVALRAEPVARRVAALMLVAGMVFVVVILVQAAISAATGTGLTAVVVTLLALAMGHVLGAPADDTRTAIAISGALRNPGLALLVATSNRAPVEVAMTVLAYLLWAAVIVTAYIAWRRRRRPAA